jgi:hypothetical protein
MSDQAPAVFWSGVTRARPMPPYSGEGPVRGGGPRRSGTATGAGLTPQSPGSKAPDVREVARRRREQRLPVAQRSAASGTAWRLPSGNHCSLAVWQLHCPLTHS